MEALFEQLRPAEEAAREFLAGIAFPLSPVLLFLRFVFPLLAILIFGRCMWPLLSGGRPAKPYAYLGLPNGAKLPLTHWENSVGRGKNCDAQIDMPSVSRTHAVISRRGGGWRVTDIGSLGGVKVNGTPCEGWAEVSEGDSLAFADVEVTFLPALEGMEPPEARTFAVRAAEIAAGFRPGTTLLFILLFQVLGVIEMSLLAGEDFSIIPPVVFGFLVLLEAIYYFVTRGRGKRYIEPELLAFFLCGIGLFVAAAADPYSMLKQFFAVLLGVGLFLVLSFFLNNIDRTRIARYLFAFGAVGLLAVNLILAETRFGARNWIQIGPLSFQPSEFVKIAFVFAGGATLERLLTKQNLIKFIGFSGVCIGAMALMRDFGGALIFFVAFVVILFMRSGDLRLIAVISTGTAAGAFVVASFMPYIAARFEAWRHAWDFVDTKGYQQTRTMIYTASGGLTGVGSGQGYLRGVAAADTDLVFGLVAEEWGLIVAMVCALTPVAFAVFAALSVRASRSALYAITACGAAAVLLTQAALNVFGSLDILPLTGVTLPFISNGGSSMTACWGLLACIKAVDERHRAQAVPDDAGGAL
ncbi:FtsW/RodA/SpoVE family cell cycle protein [Oscillospiraceae bacterium OttesenSCG-928-F05]|nr:FtsW/RodA/SpoVE family cell cycle protein [Oscillospiraceae bacterium OttesenSCG-928-F05]